MFHLMLTLPMLLYIIWIRIHNVKAWATANILMLNGNMRSIFVMWLECRFQDTEVDGSNPDISMLCHLARHFIRIASVDSAVK